MQFRDLKQQYQVLKKDMDAAMVEVATNCNFINGQQVKDLEKELAEYVGVKHCVTCANGTDALTMAMMAWGIKEGDAVFVPDFTFFSSGEIVSHAGATPVFVDVDLDTFNISVESLEAAIEKVMAEGKLQPKAIVAVDLFGLPADFAAVREVADKYGLKVLEDGAQGFGGTINGKKACSFGDISTTSFFPAKPLGCYGDGGALFTDSDEYYELLTSLRVHGKGTFKYDNVRVGMNSRLDTLQAGILLPKLKAFKDHEMEKRNLFAKQYTMLLKEHVITPYVPEGMESSWAQYTILLRSEEERTFIQERLKKKQIPTMIYYPKPLHQQSVYQDYDFNLDELKECEHVAKVCLSLPMHPYLDTETVNYIANSLMECLKEYRHV